MGGGSERVLKRRGRPLAPSSIRTTVVRMKAASVPVLEAPGLQRQLPRRQVFQSPLREAGGRPVAEAPLFLLDRFLDQDRRGGALIAAAPFLPRRVRDEVDIFRLLGHAPFPRETLA